MQDAGELAAASIIKNIVTSRQANGQSIKRNSNAWRKFKLSMGWGSKPLIAEKHRFTKGNGQSFATRATANTAIIEPATPEVRDLAQWVQEADYTGWFAVSGRGLDAIRKMLTKRVVERIRKAIK
jgi:hypothetical protein